MTDAELVARLKANDDEAYREVVARFGDPLYGYIYSIIGDADLSQDVLGETYLRMVEKIDSYSFYGVPFKAWLYRIVHNRLPPAALPTARDDHEGSVQHIGASSAWWRSKVLSVAAAAQPDFIERFHQEARLSASLRHPHIVHVYTLGEQDGLTYMVQELLPGPTLDEWLADLAD